MFLASDAVRSLVYIRGTSVQMQMSPVAAVLIVFTCTNHKVE